jgi:uncharacterized membrane protein
MGKKARKKSREKAAAVEKAEVAAESVPVSASSWTTNPRLVNRGRVPLSSVPASASPREAKPGLVNAGRTLLAIASCLAVYLVFVAVSQGSAAGCEEGSSCDSVLTSKWAKLFGTPIGVFGAVSYLALLGFSFAPGLGTVRSFLSLMIVGGALWFTAIQAFVLKTFCPWCCTTHAVASLGVLFLWLGLRSAGGSKFATRSRGLVAAGAAAVSLTVTAIAQWKAPEPVSEAISGEAEVAVVQIKAENREFVTVHDTYQLSTSELPAMGNAKTAEHVAVGFFDFSCKHCRSLNKVLKPIQAEFGNRLAILKVPAFFNQNGAKIQKLMLPVLREAPEVYEEVGNALYNETLQAKAAVVRAEFVKRFGKEQLDGILATHSKWAEELLAESQSIRNENKKVTKNGKLPQLIVGKSIEVGNKSDPGHYYQLFADHFGLKRENVPELTVSPKSIDFGRVVMASKHSIHLTLHNPGKMPVNIKDIRGPGGAKPDDPPTVLAPGESAEVSLHLNFASVKKPGKIKIFAHVSSDSATPAIRVPLEADLWDPLKIEPSALNFGTIEAGGAPKQLKATITFEAPVSLGAVTCKRPHFHPAAPFTVEPNRVYTITVGAVFPDGTSGRQDTSLLIKVDPLDDSSPWPEFIRIPLRAKVVPKGQMPAASQGGNTGEK